MMQTSFGLYGAFQFRAYRVWLRGVQFTGWTSALEERGAAEPVNIGTWSTLAEAQGRCVAAARTLLGLRDECILMEPIWTSHGVVCFCGTENVITPRDGWRLESEIYLLNCAGCARRYLVNGAVLRTWSNLAGHPSVRNVDALVDQDRLACVVGTPAGFIVQARDHDLERVTNKSPYETGPHLL